MEANEMITAFFHAYEQRINDALRGHDDIDGTVAAFAECFVSASPAGVFCGSNNAAFCEAITKGNEFYRSIHTLSMVIDHIHITRLDSMHFMARVFWQSVYNKEGKQERIDFDVIYLLQERGQAFKIFAYITGDEQKALREHGII